MGRRETLMKVTIVGSGDAFGSGGRAHTCFKIESGDLGVIVDFGAGSIGSWKKLGLQFDSIDAVVISHLHGDHFGGLPFLLYDCQFVEQRTRPLKIIGPPGLKEKLDAVLETSFPGSKSMVWRFEWTVEEILARRKTEVAGFALETFEVVHMTRALATGVRLSDGKSVFAYSGDTAWTPALIDLSAAADLFIVECFSGAEPTPNHINWPTLKANLPELSAKQVLVTHMSASAMAFCGEMEQAGLTIAYDGQTIEC
jgi:ribonuclease BN (tRNA processing enzyme)